MSFLYPNMFWGLLALLIPIAIHLFNFRKHKLVYFSNTAVLRDIQQENAKTKKLKYLVSLLLRCLFIIGLVFAFAFPYRPEKSFETEAENALIGVYLDNSMSMKARSQRTTLLEDARESARDLVDKFAPSTRFVLMTNSFEMQNEYPLSQEEMLMQIDRMSQEGGPVAMGEVIDRFEMLRKQYGYTSSTLFLFSDFQKNTFDLKPLVVDSALRVIAVPVQPESQENVYVDTVWLTSPIIQAGLTNEVNVKVVNQSEKEIKGLPLNLTMDDKLAASATVDLEANGDAEVPMQFLLEQSGRQKCSVSLTDYPITFDDSYDFVLEVKPSLSVIEIGKTATSCALVFDDDSQFRYETMSPTSIDLAPLLRAQMIIVNETASINETVQQDLLDDVAQGSSLAVFPNMSDPKMLSYLYQKLGLSVVELDENPASVDGLAQQHEFFDDMVLRMPAEADLPKTEKHVRLRQYGTMQTLLSLQNGDPLLLTEPVGKGRVFVFTTALDPSWSNLSDNALFVPILVKMALMGGQVDRIAYIIGQDKMLGFSDLDLENDLDYRLRSLDGAFELMPAAETRNGKVLLYLNEQLPQQGFYELFEHDSVSHLLAWNQSRLESKMEFADEKTIEQSLKQAGLTYTAVLDAVDFANNDLVKAMAQHSSVWKWFVLIALLALLGEAAVLRLWK